MSAAALILSAFQGDAADALPFTDVLVYCNLSTGGHETFVQIRTPQLSVR